MADTFTPHYNLTKPQVGGDSNTWGGLLNTNIDAIDTAIYNAQTAANTGVTNAAAAQATANTGVANAAAALARANTVAVYGMIMLWAGQYSQIPAHWHLCDGTAGTPDLRDRFIVGSGASYAPGYTGGSVTTTLQWGHMPPHNHGINDPGHAHGVADPGHSHGVGDPGHSHGVPGAFAVQGGSYSQEGTNSRLFAFNNNPGTDVRGTGISIGASLTGVQIYGAGTGISTASAGSGAAFDQRPPYLSLCYIMYTG